MTETSFERVFIDGTAELLPNFTLEKLMYDNFEKIGVVQHNDEERAFAASFEKSSHRRAREEFKHRAKGGYTCPIEPGTVPTAL